MVKIQHSTPKADFILKLRSHPVGSLNRFYLFLNAEEKNTESMRTHYIEPKRLMSLNTSSIQALIPFFKLISPNSPQLDALLTADLIGEMEQTTTQN